MEGSQEKMFRTIRQELEFEEDFRDVKMVCDESLIWAHKVIIKAKMTYLNISQIKISCEGK